MTALIAAIRSGGQAGVDRAALDAAIRHGIAYGGWVPKGGRTEDGIDLLGTYPHLAEMPSSDYPQRTRRNVKDSTATLIICPEVLLPISRGTLLTVRSARELRRPFTVTDGHNPDDVRAWIQTLDQPVVLNIAGPRATGWPQGYAQATTLLDAILSPTGAT